MNRYRGHLIPAKKGEIVINCSFEALAIESSRSLFMMYFNGVLSDQDIERCQNEVTLQFDLAVMEMVKSCD